MCPDQHPIPREALPPGWGLSERCDDCIVYRHRSLPLELIADRTVPTHSHPGLGLSCCWELKHRYLFGDRSIVEQVGCVSTRRAAVDGLRECMHRLHDAVDEPTDPIEVQAVLDRVSLADVIPERLS